MQISDSFFNTYITLEKPVNRKQSSGAISKSWESVTTTPIRAALQPMSSRDINQYAGRQIRVSHNCYVEEDPIFKRGYRLVDEDGKKYTIRGVINFAGADRVYKIICREILE